MSTPSQWTIGRFQSTEIPRQALLSDRAIENTPKWSAEGWRNESTRSLDRARMAPGKAGAGRLRYRWPGTQFPLLEARGDTGDAGDLLACSTGGLLP